MREIKFRGRRTDNKEWVYGHYYYDHTSKQHVIVDRLAHWTIDPETLGQYIGFKDKNAVEICERDNILQSPGFGCTWKPRKMRVEYRDASFWLCGDSGFAVILDDHDCILEVLG